MKRIARLVPGFGASSLDFSPVVQVRQFQDQTSVTSELRKRILARFQREGIEIPYPTQVIMLEKASASGRGGAESKS